VTYFDVVYTDSVEIVLVV